MSNIHTFNTMRNGNGGYRTFDNTQQGSTPIIRFGRVGQAPTSCLEAFFPDFKVKSFTFIATIVMFAIFVICKVYEYIAARTSPDPNGVFTCILYEFGAKYTPAIVVKYHLHRLFMPIVLHGGWSHIFFNMLSQWFYGYRLEAQYGTKKFALLYIIAGIGGNLFSATNTFSISVGASGSLFGLFAFYLAFLIEDPKGLGPRRTLNIVFMLVLLFSNVANASRSTGVDNTAHLGGFVFGGLVALTYVNIAMIPNYRLVQKAAIVILAVATIGLTVYIFSGRDGLVQRFTSLDNSCKVVLHGRN